MVGIRITDINPVYTEQAGKLGDRFNEERCLGCHTLNGRSLPAETGKPINTWPSSATSKPRQASYRTRPTGIMFSSAVAVQRLTISP